MDKQGGFFDRFPQLKNLDPKWKLVIASGGAALFLALCELVFWQPNPVPVPFNFIGIAAVMTCVMTLFRILDTLNNLLHIPTVDPTKVPEKTAFIDYVKQVAQNLLVFYGMFFGVSFFLTYPSMPYVFTIMNLICFALPVTLLVDVYFIKYRREVKEQGGKVSAAAIGACIVANVLFITYSVTWSQQLTNISVVA